MCGFKVVPVACDANGNVDPDLPMKSPCKSDIRPGVGGGTL